MIGNVVNFAKLCFIIIIIDTNIFSYLQTIQKILNIKEFASNYNDLFRD